MSSREPLHAVTADAIPGWQMELYGEIEPPVSQSLGTRASAAQRSGASDDRRSKKI
jgi:hypothetical protein